MSEIIYKILSILLPVFLGYSLKKAGLFGPKDYRIVTRIMLFVTMPAVVITSFSNYSMDASQLGIPALGIFINLVLIFIGFLITIPLRGKVKERELLMLMICGFNMGNFIIPFILEFVGADGVVIASLFDTGNSVMCLGGNYILISAILNSSGERITWKTVVKKLFSNPILPTYLIMASLSLAGIRLPDPVTVLLKPLADANTLTATFMLGLMMEIRFSKAYLKVAGRILGLKYLLDACIVVCCYFLMPFDLFTKQMLILCFFTPIPNMSLIFVAEMGGDVDVAGFAAMLSMLLTCVMIPAAAAFMGVF